MGLGERYMPSNGLKTSQRWCSGQPSTYVPELTDNKNVENPQHVLTEEAITDYFLGGGFAKRKGK